MQFLRAAHEAVALWQSARQCLLGLPKAVLYRLSNQSDVKRVYQPQARVGSQIDPACLVQYTTLRLRM